MNGVFELLALPTDERDHDVPTPWVLRIADSFSREPGQWSAAADELDDGHSWPLLGLVEHASSLVARDGSLRLAEQAAFAAVVRAGCLRAGERGASCREWLSRRPTGASLYDEVGWGRTFRYGRVPAGFDTDDLLARLERHRKDR